MKIGEILELTQTMNIATIAKQIDGISEKPLRALLRELGCVHHAGKKGWDYEGNDPEILGRSLFDFHKPKATKRNNASNKTTKHDSIKNVKETTNKTIKEESDIKAEIQALINGELASKPTKIYRGIYFDNDIATFLDNVKHGNKSELVNKIIRQYLIENDLI
jgi:hypothetical protein